MTDARAPTRLARIVAFGPVLLLAAVALGQVWCAGVDGRLTPAKGGGFGLFSTVDKLNNRHLRAYVGDGAPLPVPAELRRERRLEVWTLKAYPTDRRLRRFAELLAARAGLPAPYELRVEVVRMTFDSDRGEARFAPVAAVVHAEVDD